MESRPFEARLDLDRHTIYLDERSSSTDERVVELIVDGYQKGYLTFSTYHWPYVAVGPAHLLVWVGIDLYITELRPGNRLTHYELDDELHAAFPINGS